MPACVEEKGGKTSPDWYFLPQTEHDVVAAVMSEWQARCGTGATRLNTTGARRADYMTHHILVIHSFSININTWRRATQRGVTYDTRRCQIVLLRWIRIKLPDSPKPMVPVWWHKEEHLEWVRNQLQPAWIPAAAWTNEANKKKKTNQEGLESDLDPKLLLFFKLQIAAKPSLMSGERVTRRAWQQH